MYLYVFRICLFHLFVVGHVSSDILVNKYLGCYRYFRIQTSGSQTSVSLSMTIDLCINVCNNSNSTFAGLQKGNQCLCGEDFNELVPESNCMKECSGDNSQYCGGTNEQSIAVYSVCSIGYFGNECDKVCHCNQQTPCQRMTGKCPNGCDNSWFGQACDTENASPSKSEWYIGCYGDSDDRAMKGNSFPDDRRISVPTTTTNACLRFCAQNNYTYMGSQYYYQCNCGESYSRYGPSSYCNCTCTGNRSQICGGAYANSVYSVCPTGSFSVNCLSRCNCFNNTRCIFRNGTCPAGCAPGWTGDSCSLRDCSVANGNCNGPYELCETIVLKYATKTRCGCKKGYTRDQPWANCTDIHECLDVDSFCGSDTYNEPNSKTGLIVGVVLGIFFALVMLAVLGIIIYWRNLKNGHKTVDHSNISPAFVHTLETESIQEQNVDATTISKPNDSTVSGDYQALEKDKKEPEKSYTQLNFSTINKRDAVAKTMFIENDAEFYSGNRMYDSVE